MLWPTRVFSIFPRRISPRLQLITMDVDRTRHHSTFLVRHTINIHTESKRVTILMAMGRVQDKTNEIGIPVAIYIHVATTHSVLEWLVAVLFRLHLSAIVCNTQPR